MRQKVWVILLAALVAALIGAPAVLGAKSYAAERFDVALAVQEDGSVLVTETVVYRFSGGPFTYAYRDIPTNYTDGVIVESVSMDGQAMPDGDQAGQVEISEDRNAIEVRWHFEPAVDSTHSFELTYRALGVLRLAPAADLLRWQALPNDHDYWIESTTVTVIYPKAVQLATAPGLNRGQAAITAEPGQARFTAQNLKPNANFTLEMGFAPRSLITQPPRWQAAEDARAAASARLALPSALTGGLLALFGVGGIMGFTRRFARPGVTFDRSLRPTSPSTSLSPALAAAVSKDGASGDWSQALATLFDLSARGIVRIEESPTKKWYRPHDFILQRLQSPSDLRPHEEALIELVFKRKNELRSSVALSDIKNGLATRLGGFKKAVEQELAALGLLDPARKRAQRQLELAGFVLLILASILFLLVLIATGPIWALLLPVGGLAIVAIAALIASAVVSPLSEVGETERQQQRGFGEHLRAVTAGKEPVNLASGFETLLPWAAGFGLLDKWVKFFQKKGELTVPPWFASLSRAGDGSDIVIFATMMNSVNAAGSSSGGAGGGAAGGGGSGAG